VEEVTLAIRLRTNRSWRLSNRWTNSNRLLTLLDGKINLNTRFCSCKQSKKRARTRWRQNWISITHKLGFTMAVHRWPLSTTAVQKVCANG